MSLRANLSRLIGRDPCALSVATLFDRGWLIPSDAARAAEVFATMRARHVLSPHLSDGPDADRITVIAPHPDDEVIGPGGTLLRASAGGAAITVVYVTDGDIGDMGATRRAEAQGASHALGFQSVFLGASPLAIDDRSESVASLAQAIRDADSRVLFVPFVLDDNDDHRRVNQLLLAGLREGMIASDHEVWAYQVYAPLPGNVVVDITAEAPAKAAAIRSYASQARKRDWAHFALGVNAVNSRLLPGGAAARYAESFVVMPLAGYAELCAAYFGRDTSVCYTGDGYRRG